MSENDDDCELSTLSSNWKLTFKVDKIICYEYYGFNNNMQFTYEEFSKFFIESDESLKISMRTRSFEDG